MSECDSALSVEAHAGHILGIGVREPWSQQRCCETTIDHIRTSRRLSAPLPRTAPPRDCEKRCASTLRRPTTHRALQPGYTPTAIRSSSGSHVQSSCSATRPASGGSPGGLAGAPAAPPPAG